MPFLKLLFSLPGIGMMIGTVLTVIFVGLTGVSIYQGFYVSAIVTFFGATAFFIIAYIGYRLQRKIDAVAKLAGVAAKDISVELVNRVKKI